MLQNTLPIQVAIKRCVDPEESINADELQAVSEYLTGTYMKMRATDFLRQIMAHRRKSLNPGTRPRLAAIALGSSGKGETTAEIVENKYTCFFCKEEGHTVLRCDKMSAAPAIGESHSLETTIMLDGEPNTFEWHYCLACQRWDWHSPDQHKDQDSYSNTVDDSVQAQQGIDENSNVLTEDIVCEEVTEFHAVIDEVNDTFIMTLGETS